MSSLILSRSRIKMVMYLLAYPDVRISLHGMQWDIDVLNIATSMSHGRIANLRGSDRSACSKIDAMCLG